MKQKSEVLDKFKEHLNLMSNVTEERIKIPQNDDDGEYCSDELAEYLKQQGVIHQTTVPYNPAQNGVPERMNRILVESARSMMHHTNVPIKFWAEAINTGAYLRKS